MSRFKSLKEVSLKKKLFVSFIIIVLVGVGVFAVIKFGFPDPDLNRPYELAYEVGADEESIKTFNDAFDFFLREDKSDYDFDAGDRIHYLDLRDLNRLYMASLSVKEVETYSIDRLLFALSEVKNKNKIDKKIKNLEKIKEALDETKQDALSYCNNQIKTYQNSINDDDDTSMLKNYIEQFEKKFTRYLKNMRDFVGCLEEIILTVTDENIYSNALTHFGMSLTNKKLSMCVDKYEKMFLNGEAATPVPTLDNFKSFKTKDDALKTFVSKKSEALKEIEAIMKYDWLDDWLKVLGGEKEEDFVKSLNSDVYSSFKKFMQTYFTIKMKDYPEASTTPTTPTPSKPGGGNTIISPQKAFLDEAGDSQFLEVA